MCVIIVKPQGIDMPDEKLLTRAALFNPHGFGFCTSEILFKTLSINSLITKLKKVEKDEQCIIHLRYATTGSVKTANCHPFKKNGVCFAHNGILDIDTKNDTTDSETFFNNVVMSAIKKYGFDSQAFDDVMFKNAGYSRFAILKSEKIKLYGDFTDYEGCLYSNLRFLNYSHF